VVALPVAREERAGLMETAKDRWNGELEGLVRRAYGLDWKRVRGEVRGRAEGIWRRVSS